MVELRHIGVFYGEYRFLSNFYPCNITVEGMRFSTAEHAFQAMKTMDLDERLKICYADTPGQAKRLGRKVTLRPDWEQAKLDVMRVVLRMKFRNDGLRAKLLATGDATLTEGNVWHDNFWGVCTCPKCRGGQNHLGRLLMLLRDELRKEQ